MVASKENSPTGDFQTRNVKSLPLTSAGSPSTDHTHGKFEEELGQYETLKAIKILTQIYPGLVTATIGGQGFIYDKQYFTGEDIDKQVAYWERHVSIKKRLTGAIGAFHEAFSQHAIDLALKDLDIKVVFWRKIGKGKESYNIRLS